ncbi:MAG: glycosyltransferase family 39 protein [Verrucomicrobiota bacterium]|nr:glycosyltransferase family 39 protein [Verrucomicrobiota bacterium]
MQRLESRQVLLAAVALLLLTGVTRLPSLVHPQPIINEAIYSVVANEILDGGKPYVDALERKPPLLFWTYAAIFRVAGKYDWPALHAASLLWTLGTMAGLYLLGRELFDRETGLIAALLYSIFQPWARGQNLAFNGELLMNLPIVWAWAIAFRPTSSRLRPELIFSGALLAAGFLFKQPAAIAAVPLGVYLLLPGYRRSRNLSGTQSLVHAALLTLGFFGTLAAVALLLQRQGILREAMDRIFTDNSIPHFFYAKAIFYTLAFAIACLPLVLGTAMACRERGLWKGREAERSALLGLMVASLIGTAAGGRFYVHYYVQMIPVLAVLAAPLYAELWSGRLQPRSWWLRPRVTFAWLALTALVFSLVHWLELLPLRQPSQAGAYLREHSAPHDRIFVWGQAAKIYLEAQRRPASRYVEAAPLTGHVFGGVLPGVDTRKWIVPGAWENLTADFAKHPPAYIVDVQSDIRQPHPIQDFPLLATLLRNDYHPVAQTLEGTIYQRNDARAGL